jgi:transcriptional regulator with XRE-family HTH domain
MASRGISTLDRAVAKRIRALADDHGMKQADVADAAGITRTTFGRYWRAERSMTLDDLEHVLAALGTSYPAEYAVIRDIRRRLDAAGQ